MAAEMSTGVLAMAHIYKTQPGGKHAGTDVKGNFIKKATGKPVLPVKTDR